MFSRFSVKKPYVILVAVIVAMLLGGVSLSRMQTSLMPDMDLPYLAIVTTEVGASPEKVEADVTEPLEAALGVVSGVNTVSSTSNENYSMVMLEFAEDTDMNAAMVKVSAALNTATANFPEQVGTPNVIEINMDSMATMYAAVSYEGKDIYQTSAFTTDTIIPYLSRQTGVSSVSATGIVTDSVEIRLNQSKVDAINEKILGKTNDTLAEKEQELNDGKASLDNAANQLSSQKDALAQTQSSTADQLGQGEAGLTLAISASMSKIATLQASAMAIQSQLESLSGATGSGQISGSADTFGANAGSAGGSSGAAAGGTTGTTTGSGTSSGAAAGTGAASGSTSGSTSGTATGATGSSTGQSVVGTGATQTLDPAAQQAAVQSQAAQLTAQLQEIQKQLIAEQETLKTYQDQLAQVQAGSVSAAAQFGSADAQMSAAQSTIDQNKSQLDSAQSQLDSARDDAVKNSNIDSLVSMDTLSQMITAQNLAMPAGYVKDQDSNQWMVRVGQEYSSVDDVRNMLLTTIDGVGDIRLQDVADITVIDDADQSYAKVNGQPGVVLSIFKTSTAATSDVSAQCNKALASLVEDNPGLRIDSLMDQGEYIQQFISTILTSILLGSLLAIVVLALFLRGIRPTLVVAFSIPFSVLVALLAMYFAGLSLNIMSLGALSLAIGMLVDNSVVVLENIYRLRSRGLSAPRAAVQGAKQVSGAILSSTLTTICVFLPLVFTTGLTRQMMLPFALTISFSLLASLAVALTVVPTLGSVVLKKNQPKEYGWFLKLQEAYGRALAWALRFKAIPLALAIILLGASTAAAFSTGITLIPDMASKQISAQVTLPEGTDDATSFATADKVMEAMQGVEGVDFVGAMDASAATAMQSGIAGADVGHTEFYFYAIPDSTVTTESQIKQMTDALEEATKDLGCEVALSASAMGDTSAMLGSGLQIDIDGEDVDELNRISQDVMAIVGEVPGYTEVKNGQENGDSQINIVVDKDAAMRLNTPVAQIYSDIAAKLTTDKSSASMTLEDTDMDVKIVDETDTLTKESLLGMTFDCKVTDSDGNQKTETHRLGEIAHIEEQAGYEQIARENGVHRISVTADVEDGYNNALLARDLQTKLDAYQVPDGYTVSTGGEIDNINEVMFQMMQLILLGFLLVYLVMVAQFQSLLSPFIIIFTIPLAFTGGMLALLAAGEQITLMSGMGFVVLMGTVVNNGIVFVDYVNQLRIGGMEKRDALVAAGKTRMRPIFMTALTTILAMSAMIFSQEIGASMQRGMALVVAGGLAYATLMTLFIVPIVYDLLYRKQPKSVDVGDDDMDDTPDDATEFIEQLKRKAQQAADEQKKKTPKVDENGFGEVNPAKPLTDH